MGILDKIGDVSKGVSDKTKSMSEANNLKRFCTKRSVSLSYLLTSVRSIIKIPTEIRLI